MTSLLAPLVLLASVPAPETVTLDVNGLRRQALVYRSSVPPPESGAPVVFAFHGHGGTMRSCSRSQPFHELWPEAIAVYMQGLPTSGRTDPEGKRPGWQNSRGLYDDRDLAFFDAMYAKVKSDFKVDVARVYAMGHSNGGRFTYLLWSERPTVLAAVAPSAAPCGLLRLTPKSAFIVAGEQDELVSFASQKASIERVRRILECEKTEAKPEGYLRRESAPGGFELATYVYPGTHKYPAEATAHIVEFFKRHAKT